MLVLVFAGAVVAEINGKNTLILWFSKAGATKRVAEAIAADTGGQLLEIRSDVDYSGFKGYLLAARDYLFPPKFNFLTSLPDLTPYSYVFVASPVWSANAAPVVNAFLDKLDFGGRTVIPVGICRSKMNGFASRVGAHLTNAKLVEKDGFYGVGQLSDAALKDAVKEWLAGI
jgi:flavodoxin